MQDRAALPGSAGTDETYRHRCPYRQRPAAPIRISSSRTRAIRDVPEPRRIRIPWPSSGFCHSLYLKVRFNF